jgi:hypothetical protein
MNVTLSFICSNPSPVSRANPSNPNTLQKEAKSMKLYLVHFLSFQESRPAKPKTPTNLKNSPSKSKTKPSSIPKSVFYPWVKFKE